MRLSSFFVTCRGRTGSIILIWPVFCIIHLSIALMLIFWSVVFVKYNLVGPHYLSGWGRKYNSAQFSVWFCSILASIKNSMIPFVCPSKILHKHCPWEHCKSQEKIKTMLMQNFWGTNKEYHAIFDWLIWNRILIANNELSLSTHFKTVSFQ